MAETHRVKHTSLEASVASMPSLQSKLGEAYASGGLVMSIKLKMRELAELDSNPVGAVDAGTRVQIVEHCQLPDGTKRARIALQEDADAKPMGWVSLYSKEDGAAHLVPAPALEHNGSAATHREPSVNSNPLPSHAAPALVRRTPSLVYKDLEAVQLSDELLASKAAEAPPVSAAQATGGGEGGSMKSVGSARGGGRSDGRESVADRAAETAARRAAKIHEACARIERMSERRVEKAEHKAEKKAVKAEARAGKAEARAEKKAEKAARRAEAASPRAGMGESNERASRRGSRRDSRRDKSRKRGKMHRAAGVQLSSAE